MDRHMIRDTAIRRARELIQSVGMPFELRVNSPMNADFEDWGTRYRVTWNCDAGRAIQRLDPFYCTVATIGADTNLIPVPVAEEEHVRLWQAVIPYLVCRTEFYILTLPDTRYRGHGFLGMALHTWGQTIRYAIPYDAERWTDAEAAYNGTVRAFADVAGNLWWRHTGFMQPMWTAVEGYYRALFRTGWHWTEKTSADGRRMLVPSWSQNEREYNERPGEVPFDPPIINPPVPIDGGVVQAEVVRAIGIVRSDMDIPRPEPHHEVAAGSGRPKRVLDV